MRKVGPAARNFTQRESDASSRNTLTAIGVGPLGWTDVLRQATERTRFRLDESNKLPSDPGHLGMPRISRASVAVATSRPIAWARSTTREISSALVG